MSVCGPSHGRACCVGVWSPPMVGRAVLARGTPHCRACWVLVWPPSWWGVLCRCMAPLMVGRALLLPACRGECAWCGCAWLRLSSYVPPGSQRCWVRVGGVGCGVSAGAMRGVFCLFNVVFAALWLACLDSRGRRLGFSCGSVDRLAGVGSVQVRCPPHGGVCCVCARPPPMVGCAVLVCGHPRGGACSIGLWSPSW